MRRTVILSFGLCGLVLACNGGGAGTSSGSATDTDPTTSAGTDTGTDTGTGTDTDTGGVAECLVEPLPESQIFPGKQQDGSVVTVNGRRTMAMGPATDVAGMPVEIELHPLLDVAYVASASRFSRRLWVMDTITGEMIQDISAGDIYSGMAVTSDGGRLFASRGVPTGVDVYDIAADGTLTKSGTANTTGWSSGLQLSSDDATLFVAMFDRKQVAEIDTATLTITKLHEMGQNTFDVLHLEGRNELYGTDFAGESVIIYDRATEAVAETITLASSPGNLAASVDESTVWVTNTGTDTLAAIDTATRQIVNEVFVAEDDFVDDMGRPLPGSNAANIILDPVENRLYVPRGSDAAVSVFDADTLDLLGSFPTNWYPNDLALSPDGSKLIVVDGKGEGISGPGGSAKSNMHGTVTFVDRATLDLATTTDIVVQNFRRQLELNKDTCGAETGFPIPSEPGQQSPIEKVILVVKENKTYDCVFGDFDEIDAERDPAFLEWTGQMVPNQRALAKTFTISDNFYTDAMESDSGHVFWTAGSLTHWVERIWHERDDYDVLPIYPIMEPSEPDRGNLFSWVLDHDKTLRVYGEIVGMGRDSTKGEVGLYSDSSYPGGPIVTYGTKDAVKAQYVADKIMAGDLADFTFISLPNDHGDGIKPGVPTPESMTADNDEGVGILADALSHSKFWDRSVMFVVEDDPQGCGDHIDGNRSFLIVVSPYARRDHVSHVQHSFLSVQTTILRILGLPPLGRPDAAAAPLYDFFTNVPDLTPYDKIDRLYPEETGLATYPGVEASRCMDFRGPDRNPGLGIVYEHYRAFRRGELTKQEADANIAAQLAKLDEEELEEAGEEAFAYDRALARYSAWRKSRGESVPVLTGRGPDPDCKPTAKR